MNPIVSDEQLPAQPPRSSIKCDRHPDESFTGFCPSCLCERLSVLDSQSAASCSTGRKSASAAIKSLFNGPALRGRASTSSFLPELRRTKSFSGGKNDAGFLGVSSSGFEPQRKSCDVRGRSTLFSLLTQENCRHGDGDSALVVEFNDGDNVDVDIDVPATVVEVAEVESHNGDGVGEGEIQEVREDDNVVDLKTMKDYIEIDTSDKKGGGGGGKDLKELAGSFWSAASVFSKKLRAWTKKNHKMKKRNGCHTVQISGKKGNAGRNCRDTQSEIADYGFGRRSCDSDPRFSLDAGRYSVDVVGPGRYSVDAGRYSVDAGRMSFDDPRGSFDEPRASWDGYLIGRSGFPRMIPPMVSVVEDAPVVVTRNDMQIPVEEPRRSSVSIGGDDCGLPGGAAQTKDYYSDSSSKRRKSLDRSSSIRKTAAAVVAEMDEMKSNGCNVKVAPPNCVDYLNNGGPRIVANDRDLNTSSNSLRDNYSESFDLGFRDNASIRKGSKKSRRWKPWNIWSLLYRRSSTKDEDDDRYSKTNGVGRSMSESWQEYRKDGYGDPRATFGRNVLRSNSSVSWRNSSYNVGGSFGSSIRQGNIEVNANGTNGRKKKDEFVLERNRSARYSHSPKHGDNNNGMLRFYLTPTKGSRRGSSGKPKPAYSQSFARNMLRLY